MKHKAVQSLAALALVLAVGITAEAQQLPKQGTYTSTFGWHVVPKVYEGDKDRTVVAAEYTGLNLTDGGQPFLHQAAVVCPALAEVTKGVGKNQGYCIATDRDGDKAFLVFKCTAQPGARCEGDFQWTGGTGKYVGLRGNNSFNGGPIPKTMSGYSAWKGEWQLPD